MSLTEKEELSEVVAGIIRDHKVVSGITFDYGAEQVWWCSSCSYLGDQEPPSLHTSNIVLEYLEEYYKERFDHVQD